MMALNITAWCEIFVVFDYLEYILAKSSNRPLSCLLFFLTAIGSLTISFAATDRRICHYHTIKGLALFCTLYSGGPNEYSYTHFQNSQDFALSGGYV